MKNTVFTFMIAGLLMASTGCEKLKFDDEVYLKYEAGGQQYSHGSDEVYADVTTINNVEVWSISKGCAACENSFYLQSRTSLAIDTPQPIIYLIAGDEAGVYLGNVYYKLKNGVVTLKHMSTTSGGNAYMEGEFRMTLINDANNLDTLQVTNGSFFHNNY